MTTGKITMNITFKKHPKSVGLGGIGSPLQSVDIKVDRKVVGMIAAPTWQTPDNKWRIRLSIVTDNERCGWRLATLKARFDDEQSARDYVKKNLDNILQQNKWTLHQ